MSFDVFFSHQCEPVLFSVFPAEPLLHLTSVFVPVLLRLFYQTVYEWTSIIKIIVFTHPVMF